MGTLLLTVLLGGGVKRLLVDLLRLLGQVILYAVR
jgi:hypothetical protein